jgi:hypothetical protein
MADTIYTVTEMAKMVGVTNDKNSCPSAVKLNLIMQDLGIQTKVNGKWKPNKEYQQFAVLVGVEPNLYYKWKDDMLLVLIKGLGRMVSGRY